MEDKIMFVDTNWFIALYLENDEFHQLAVDWWRGNKKARLLTTNAVIWETLGWIRYKVGQNRTIKVGQKLMAPNLKTERVSVTDEELAREYFVKISGRGVSMIDCLSMAVMKRLKIKKILTFDSDFEKAGFETISG